MDLNRFPRRRYSSGPTPIEKLENLSSAMGKGSIYIKRDDMLGLAGGGNKTRKLEFLLADALAQGADTILTCGAPQSNHCRLTLAAAVKEGLSCQLLLAEMTPGAYDPRACGNNLLFNILGAEAIHVRQYPCDFQAELEALANSLKKQGRKPYIIPMGGSNKVGALGYVDCALELFEQLQQQQLNIGHIVCTSGSNGTHAGLLTGLHGLGTDIALTGFSIHQGKEEQASVIYRLAKETAALVGLSTFPPASAIALFDEYVGEGYTIPTPQMVEAVRLLARTESILLDPVYTGKTMAGMLDLLKQDYFGNQDILFLHTGGSPVLHPYAKEFFN